jgi:hypothetical protein
MKVCCARGCETVIPDEDEACAPHTAELAELIVADDDRCRDCTWNGDFVATQCAACKTACDKMIDHLIAARVERSSGPRGQA